MLSRLLLATKPVLSRGAQDVLWLVSLVSGEEVHTDLDKLPLEMYPQSFSMHNTYGTIYVHTSLAHEVGTKAESYSCKAITAC